MAATAFEREVLARLTEIEKRLDPATQITGSTAIAPSLAERPPGEYTTDISAAETAGKTVMVGAPSPVVGE